MAYTGLSKVIDVESLPGPEDRFILTNLIGEGTYGEVYEATLVSDPNRRVAIKILENIQENIEEIEQEYLVLSTHWIHPNIPHFEGLYLKREATKLEDQIWIVMELCDGGSVTDLINALHDHSLPKLSEEELSYILSEVVHALVYLHSHKTVHRDVKGHNILLNSEGDVKLIDYGIACNIKHTLDKRHTSVGTPYWMAPEVILCEQQRTHEYDSRCDVWSLGITAIEIADGKAPLSDVHPMRALFQIPRNPPPSLATHIDWSENFVEFVGECLIKDNEQRPFIMELVEHPFLVQVPKNPSHIKRSIRYKIEAVKSLYNSNKKVDPTTRKGLLRLKRNVDPIPMLRDDLASLDEFDVESIINHLHRRYIQNKIYSYIGEILISINPYKQLNLYSAHEMCRYRNKSKFDNPPHVFAMANSAYHNMIHEKKNQRFIISGESGAGKTVSVNLVTKMLVFLGKAPNRNIEDKIMQINPILEAFGNAHTPLNKNSSRFAKFIELTYSQIGKITGARISVFLLEHSRIVSNRDVEDDFNFHAFYTILIGLNHYNRSEEFRIKELHKFLGDQHAAKIDEFNELVSALKAIGFRESDLSTIYRIISSILNIGDLEFQAVPTDDNVGGCRVENPEVLEAVSFLLGVNRIELEDCLENSTVSARGEVITRRNSVEDAKSVRDALAKGLYSRLFDYIVYLINKLLSYSLNVYGECNSVGILDIFGFESLHKNSFEQLCINTANEQIFYYFNQAIFRWEQEEYTAEGIMVNVSNFWDNHKILDLMLSRPLGLFSLLDEECKFPSATDITLLSKLDSNLAREKVYERPKQDLSYFVICHYAGKVEYSPAEFLEKNRNFLPPELISVMRTSEHEVIRFIYNCSLLRTGRLSCLSGTGMNTPNTPILDGFMNRTLNETHSQTRSQQTLSTFFRYSLLDMLRQTMDGTPHFIMCFRPNVSQTPAALSIQNLKRQIIYAGIHQTVEIRQNGFPCRLTFGEFLRRYCFLAFSFDERVVATRENVQILLLRLRMDDYAIGKTKVFLKYFHVEYLSKLYEYQIRKIIKVQGIVRQWLAKINTQKMKWRVARELMLSKRFIYRWKVRAKSKAILTSGSSFSVERAPQRKSREKYILKEEAALEIQRHIRGYLARKKIGPLLAKKIATLASDKEASVEKIQNLEVELKNEGLSEDEAATLIQTMFKRAMLRKRSSKFLIKNKNRVSAYTKEEKSSITLELMQTVHLNNVDAHKYFRQNKDYIDLDNVKEVNLEFPIITVSSPVNLDKAYEQDPEILPSPKRPASLNIKTVDPKSKRRHSLTHFYSDSGPQDSWDALITRRFNKISRSRGLKTSSKNIVPNILAPQSVVVDSVSSDMLDLVQKEVTEQAKQRRASLISPGSKSPIQVSPIRKTPEKLAFSPNPPQKKQRPRASFIEQMHSLKRTTRGDERNNVDDDESHDDSGPYDFRNLLRRTNFGATDSIRRRLRNVGDSTPKHRPKSPNFSEDIKFDGEGIDL